jgi:hypothetical protein
MFVSLGRPVGLDRLASMSRPVGRAILACIVDGGGSAGRGFCALGHPPETCFVFALEPTHTAACR